MGRLIMEDMRDTMQRMITSVVVAVLWGGFTGVAAGLLAGPNLLQDLGLFVKHPITSRSEPVPLPTQPEGFLAALHDRADVLLHVLSVDAARTEARTQLIFRTQRDD